MEPEVVFTGLKLFNDPVTVGDETKLLAENISHLSEIVFDHKQSSFTVDFAVLSYIRSDLNKYAYKLEGFDEKWNYVQNPSAIYTNLPAGNYTLLARGSNNDGVWSGRDARIAIKVLPPWWDTWLARMVFFLAAISVLFFVIRFFWLRDNFRRQAELQRSKLDFFTNISHEIRTHLTLVGGPIELIEKQAEAGTKTMDLARIAKNNSDRLLRLVNELLDFRKLESGKTSLRLDNRDIVSFLVEIQGAFVDFAGRKHIQSEFQSNSQWINLWFDPDQLQKVFFNLLMNAYKFTDDHGTVKLSVLENVDSVSIKIIDNGPGIAPKYLEKLFQNYYQVYDFGQKNTGYGIGLALSREVVNAHKGLLEIESKQDPPGESGTTFTVTLLKGRAHLDGHHVCSDDPSLSQAISPGVDAEPKEELIDRDKNIVLIVEDNVEMRAYIKSVLGEEYFILEAGNGLEGFTLANESIPDLIVSDFLMAGMDGLELCEKIKSNERTSHIPVILLTAKQEDTHLRSLDAGANAYIAKPFDSNLLMSAIRNIFKTRQDMQLRYSKLIRFGKGIEDEVVEPEEKFLKKIVDYLEENIESTGIGIPEIANYVGMSKSSLYRKLKATTSLTIHDIIRTVKLRKAVSLLQQNDLAIYEVASRAGFADSKHFSKVFKKEFGVAPSEFVASKKSESESVKISREDLLNDN